MIQLIQASTYFQLVSLAAMADAGVLPAADQRVLVLASGSQMPETTPPLALSPGFELLAARFDAVVDLADLLWPRRCSQFNPRHEELPLLEALLRSHWKLGNAPVSLVLESIQVNPAQALARIFFDAPISVHSDGLMSYGPTRSALPQHMLQRLETAIHIDLVPGLEPLLLAEMAIDRRVLHLDALASVFVELSHHHSAEEFGPTGSCALILGQYLGSLGILDAAKETELHREMLLAARAHGADLVLFKPHPSAGATSAMLLRVEAEALGLEFRVLQTPLLAETVIDRIRPRVVVSCFSTALLTAKYMLGTPVLAVGTGTLLQDLAPYQNSNRIPLSIIDALLVAGLEPPASTEPETDELTALLRAVSYCMQAGNLPELREETAQFLDRNYARHSAHFKRKRLAALGLPPYHVHPGRIQRTSALVRRIRRRALRAGSRTLNGLASTLEKSSRHASR